jgi:hypothetical protein
MVCFENVMHCDLKEIGLECPWPVLNQWSVIGKEEMYEGRLTDMIIFISIES